MKQQKPQSELILRLKKADNFGSAFFYCCFYFIPYIFFLLAGQVFFNILSSLAICFFIFFIAILTSSPRDIKITFVSSILSSSVTKRSVFVFWTPGFPSSRTKIKPRSINGNHCSYYTKPEIPSPYTFHRFRFRYFQHIKMHFLLKKIFCHFDHMIHRPFFKGSI